MRWLAVGVEAEAAAVVVGGAGLDGGRERKGRGETAAGLYGG